ncbi:16S rRNA (uracil(1498)-N(3))-methyltransferase [Lichenifustis flavocetrariae]|uniref:Ribosomal RNA small subunit methyltransferase E n=1 Tax=Lichenifustis flavocetrariae TaxID=2949735 RepID=A0AA42CNZ3_9HYPH|nr:16S rRNA (uracil(1498)-N(3))-methyltransferase [Lichenifustis flavocetrariae]MCW6509902.1 16S rRNA (uracil(1498)-N(3))-methyltransferase [Lichenifustis flavocetrariae]
MSRQDFTSPRLFVAGPLEPRREIALDKGHANYLRNVLRLNAGASVLIFNGMDGEWRASLSLPAKGAPSLTPVEQIRAQPPAPDLLYGFAPLKHARLDYMVQKAVEMGAGVLQPVMTHRTQATRVNLERMRANVVEASEQCGILHVPEVRDDLRLDALLAAWPADRLLVFCDEDAEVGDPVQALRQRLEGEAVPPLGLLIGPEGGFDDMERAALCRLPQTIRLSLGPRILRADTAAVAALAVVQAALGDWR